MLVYTNEDCHLHKSKRYYSPVTMPPPGSSVFTFWFLWQRTIGRASSFGQYMHRGYVKLFRKITEWGWYTDSHTLHLLIHFLIKANHKPKHFRGILIERGSLVCGLPALRQQTGISIQSLRTSIEHLKSTGEVTVKVTNRFSIVSVSNYEDYQDEKSAPNTPTNSPGNSQLTVNQQSTNSLLTTSKEVKKEKNDKKEKNINIKVPEHLEFVWLDFLIMRKSLRKTATVRAQELIIKKLEELAPGNHELQVKIIEQSIIKSWQDVFPIGGNNGQYRRHNEESSTNGGTGEPIGATAKPGECEEGVRTLEKVRHI